MKHTQSFLSFINKCPTPYHVVAQIQETLLQNDYANANTNSESVGSKFFLKRAETSLIALSLPQYWNETSRIIVYGSHTDSPCVKLKPNALFRKDHYSCLNTEIYGSPIWSTWLDRDLGIHGAVLFKNEGALELKVATLPVNCKIPQLAIHLDRDTNKGQKLNPQSHLIPLLSGDVPNPEVTWSAWLEGILNIPLQSLRSYDLFLADTQDASLFGTEQEFISSPRLDNLVSVFASLCAQVDCVQRPNDLVISAFFNHEEIGSKSMAGAASSFLEEALRVALVKSGYHSPWSEALRQRSLFVSLDMAHGVHPNYPERHDPQLRPILNAGPVIKYNHNQRYATELRTAALVCDVFKTLNLPYQEFSAHSDLGCGSTIGPTCAAQLGIPTIDLGNPMLSMHSIRETGGTKDLDILIEFLTKLPQWDLADSF
jgi:aspartyl aminopeptidase